MNKIPVGATIAQTYRFAFGDFLKILGVVWLPMVICSAPGILFQSRMQALSAQLMARDFSAVGPMMAILIPLYAVIFILLFMQVIGIAKLALGIRKGPAWFYFSLDKPVWRLIGSMLLLMVAALVGWLLALLGGALIGLLTGFLAKLISNAIFGMLMAAVVLVLALALWCGWFYSLIRLSFLLVPVIAAEEEGFSLGRTWTLGQGNFWRMFVILVVVLLPFLALEGFVFFYLIQGIPLSADPAVQAAYQAAINAKTQAMVAQAMHYWYLTYPVGVVFVVLFYGSITGAQCFAYRAVASGEIPGG